MKIKSSILAAFYNPRAVLGLTIFLVGLTPGLASSPVGAHAFAQVATNATSVAAPGISVSNGSSIYVAVSIGSTQTVTSVTDSDARTYALATRISNNSIETEIWYTDNVGSDANLVVTANFSGSATATIEVAEIQGTMNPSLDFIGTNTGHSLVAGATVNSSVANDFAFLSVATANNGDQSFTPVDPDFLIDAIPVPAPGGQIVAGADLGEQLAAAGAYTLSANVTGHGTSPVDFAAAIVAIKLQPPAQTGPSFVVTNTGDSDSGSCGVGSCDLREAINAANAYNGAATITFNIPANDPGYDSSTSVYTITLGSTLPAINNADGLTIDGTGESITVSGNNSVRAMTVNSGATLTLLNLTIANGYINGVGNGGGGGIFNGGTLTVTNSTFSGNHSDGGDTGGGIFNGGTLTVTNSTFSGNQSAAAGGGIFNGALALALGNHMIGQGTPSNNQFTSPTVSVSGGSSVYVAVSQASGGAPVLSVTDSQGDTYTSAVVDDYESGSHGETEIWYCDNVAANSALSVTATFSGFVAGVSVEVVEVKGAANPSLDYVFNGISTTRPTVSATVTSSANGEIALMSLANDAANQTITPVAPTFLLDQTSNGPLTSGLLAQLLGTAGDYTMSADFNYSAAALIAAVTIKPAASGPGTLTITNSTFSGNSATVGGGIDNSGGSVTLTNTIIANSSSGGDYAGGGLTADSSNLADDNTCGSATQKTSAQINLQALANNGGLTDTMALGSGSVAINAGEDVTTLANNGGSINNSQTMFNVANSTPFPAGVGFVIQIDSEQMIVTAKSGNTLTVIRGTPPATHNDGAAVNPAFDQRGPGFHRKIGSAIDVGAVELDGLNITDSDPTANSVAEGAAAGTTVGLTASAPDADGLSVTYSLTGDTSGGGFTIDPSSGVVTVADSSKIDYESAPGHSYTVTVKADNGVAPATKDFVIAVSDVAPSTPIDSNSAANTVQEHSATGTTVGVTAFSTDVNGGTVSYSLTGDTSGGGFTINSSTGVVTVATGSKIGYAGSAPSHTYSITVQASDGTLASSQSFVIAVTSAKPQSHLGTANGSGTIFTHNNQASFSFSISDSNNTGTPSGSLSYTDSKGGIKLTSTAITGISLLNNQATFSGKGTMPGSKPNKPVAVSFTVIAVDNGTPGAPKDTFEIMISTPYFADGNLTSGNIVVH